jgi:hypothetical protein
MSALDTAEYRRLALLAAGVDPSQIPAILDTATWRRLMIAALLAISEGGGGAGYVNGSVQFYADLPVTVGTPPVNTAYLVREDSGVWFINRKPAGIYVRLFNNGTLADWDYAGEFPSVNDSQYFRIYDTADPTREIAFSAASIAAGQTRTITVPNKNITLDDAGDSRTPLSHTHGNLTNDGKLGTTANLPLKTGTNGVIEAGSFSNTAGSFCAGDDARLSDDRDPNLHAASHAAGGSDPVLPVALYDAADDSIVLEYDSSSGWVGLTSASTFRTQLELGTAATSNTGDFAASGSITTSGLTQATSRLIGRTSSGTGAIEEIQIGSGLSLSAGQLSATASGGITAVGASTADVLSVSGSDLVADDAGADRIIFWDDSESKLRYLEAGSGLSISGTTMTVTATGGATNLWIPASAWIPRTTNGCGVDSREQATNRVNTDELLFEAATSEEFAQALVVMPSNYNNSTLSARFYWSAASGGSGGVAWGISGRAYGDDDPIDAASGTRVVVTDTFITANDVHVTSATGAVTIAGTPAANKAINFQIVREIGNASDTLGVDARLLGVEIIFN